MERSRSPRLPVQVVPGFMPLATVGLHGQSGCRSRDHVEHQWHYGDYPGNRGSGTLMGAHGIDGDEPQSYARHGQKTTAIDCQMFTVLGNRRVTHSTRQMIDREKPRDATIPMIAA